MEKSSNLPEEVCVSYIQKSSEPKTFEEFKQLHITSDFTD